MMYCPKCDSRTKVMDSRERKRYTYRKRVCFGCGYQFRTHEYVDWDAVEKEKKRMGEETPERYSRSEDMSPDGRLDVILQPDGDVIVSLRGHSLAIGMNRDFVQTEVEFCTIGAGGGRSPHTRAALVALAKAIERDNEENPIPRNS